MQQPSTSVKAIFSRITAAVRELRSEQQSMVRKEADDAKAALNAVYDNLTEQLQSKSRPQHRT